MLAALHSIRTVLLLAAAAIQSQDPAIAPVVKAAPHRTGARTPAAQINPNLVYLDAAHGHGDAGARLGENALEKDITFALAGRIQATLEARGFTVVKTRGGTEDDVSQDQRIELANRSHAGVCLLLHATGAGHGLHLYASSLSAPAASAAPRATPADPAAPVPIAAWDTAQVPFVAQSLRLSSTLATAFTASHLPLVLGRSSPRPIDAIACPAVAIELAPYAAGDDASLLTPPTDTAYQQRVADLVAVALASFRGFMQTQAVPGTQPVKPAAKAKLKPGQDAPQPAIRTPAPIVRKIPGEAVPPR